MIRIPNMTYRRTIVVGETTQSVYKYNRAVKIVHLFNIKIYYSYIESMFDSLVIWKNLILLAPLNTLVATMHEFNICNNSKFYHGLHIHTIYAIHTYTNSRQLNLVAEGSATNVFWNMFNKINVE